MLINYNLHLTKLGCVNVAYGMDSTFNVSDNAVYTLKQAGTATQTYYYLFTCKTTKETKERI